MYCPHRLEVELLRRGGSHLCIEPMQPAPRCFRKQPDNWPREQGMGMRWLLSGGDATVFGPCNRKDPQECPLAQEQP